ncbi:MAG: hypothetical protein JO250_11440 [Armatimonadetes bacterium]|nr:hypothetical protein [Armatimonadota bacterium]
MSQFVRVLTNGQELDAINDDIVRAGHGGRRGQVKAAAVADGMDVKPDGDRGTVANWAGALAREHGLAWRRVGLDGLFERRTPD